MRVLLLFTIFGLALSSLTPNNTQELEVDHSLVPHINNNGNAQVVVQAQDGSYRFPLEIWCDIMGFLDPETGQNMVLPCKTFYQVWMATHFERVQRWMINGSTSGSPNAIQNHLLFDRENASVEIYKFMIYSKLSPLDKKILLSVMRGMKKLKLPYSVLLNLLLERNEGFEYPDAEELVLSVNADDTSINFQQLQSVFPNIKLLEVELGLDKTLIMPFTAEELFSAIPMLGKLVIHISNSEKYSATVAREEFVALLDILRDERVELKIVSQILSERVFGWFSEIFNSELEKQVKKRLFLFLQYRPQILEYAKQIHTLGYLRTDEIENESLDVFLSKIGMFDHLKKLYMTFNGAGIPSLTESELKPLLSLVELYFECNAPQCQTVFELLFFVFPNLTTLQVSAAICFDSLPTTFLQLKKLERIHFRVSTTKKGLIRLLKAVANGAFPRLRELRLPDITADDKNSNISDEQLKKIVDQMVYDYPLINFLNRPF